MGVNGLYIYESKTVNLVKRTPEADSMLAPNPGAVVESLKRARRLHGFSMSLVGIYLLIIFLGLTEVPFPWAKDVKITSDRFVLLSMPISIGLLSIVNSFMNDALSGSRYLYDSLSAMTVGKFPWSLSKYASRGRITIVLSFFIRLIMALHPVAYLWYLSTVFFDGEERGIFSLLKSGERITIDSVSSVGSISFFIVCLIPLLLLSFWTFLISQKFQKPILFNPEADEDEGKEWRDSGRTDVLAQLMIEKGIITQEEFFTRLKQVQAEYQRKQND